MTNQDPRFALLRGRIRDVPDFPKPGILFKDITPLLGDASAFTGTIDLLAEHYAHAGLSRVAVIESRGFLFGAGLATKLRLPLALVRKPGKLPYKKQSVRYALEYGEGTLEMHVDAIGVGERVLIVDDVLATGGTAAAAAQLIEGQGGRVHELAFVVELGFLHGRKKLEGRSVFSLIQYA